MALQIEIDGDVVASGAFKRLDDHVLADSGPSYPTAALVLRNTGVASITVSAAAVTLWTRRFSLTGLPAVPFSIAASATASGTITALPRGPLDPEVYTAGVPNGRLDFTHAPTSGGSATTDWCEIAQAIRLETPAPGYSFPTEANFARYDAQDLYVLSNAPSTPTNVYGFNPVEIETEGHVAAFWPILEEVLDLGQTGVWLHSEFANPPGEDYRVDARQIQIEREDGNQFGHAYYEAMLDLIDAHASLPDITHYIGRPSNALFKGYLTGNDWRNFTARWLGCLPSWAYRPRHHLAIDTPYVLHDDDLTVIGPDSPYYRGMLLWKELFVDQMGKMISMETLPLEASDHFHKLAGFDRCGVYRLLWRTHRDWFAGNGSIATEAHCGIQTAFHTAGSANIMPYQIASAMSEGWRSSLFLGYNWYGLGHTRSELYDATKAIRDYAGGVVVP